MKKGQIIYLSGVTSTGKTSIARAIQAQADDFYYVVGSDILEDMVPEKYRDGWTHMSVLFIDMYHFAALLSDRGKNVIIDTALFEIPELPHHYQQMMQILGENPLLTVNVACPLEICRKRNLARGDRGEFQSDEQDTIMDKTVTFDFEVRSDLRESAENAELILARVRQ